jgi:hypothetical protein
LSAITAPLWQRSQLAIEKTLRPICSCSVSASGLSARKSSKGDWSE